MAPPQDNGLEQTAEATRRQVTGLTDSPIELDLRRVLGATDLTKRQQDVALLIALGMSSPEVCETLGMRNGTFRCHMRAVHRSMGTRDRNAVTSRLLQQVIRKQRARSNGRRRAKKTRGSGRARKPPPRETTAGPRCCP